MSHVRPKIIPDFSPYALTAQAHGFTTQAHYREAYEILEVVLTVQPKFMAAYNGLGNCLKGMGEPDMALDAYRRALALSPQDPFIYMNIGSTLLDVGQIQEASTCLITALTLAPELAEAKWNLAICLLSSGQLFEGFMLAQDRWAAAKFQTTVPNYPVPYWSGEKDARVLVWGEQGMGERILYLPMLQDLVRYGCKVYREADDRIRPLWARSMPDVTFVGDGHKFQPGEITHHIAIGDLGPFFRAKFEDFPKHSGYLTADPQLAMDMLLAMKTGDYKQVIGICWRSGNQEYGGHKSMHILEMIEPLMAAYPDALLVNLQYGDTAADCDLVRALTGREILTVPGLDMMNNFEGLAGLMSICDAVVTVSNTHAHLAAALGRPTFICLPQHNCRFWYWFMDREDSPWYPAAKLVRQNRHGFWGDVMDRVVEGIHALQ